MLPFPSAFSIASPYLIAHLLSCILTASLQLWSFLTALLGRSKSTFYHLRNAGCFPYPVAPWQGENFVDDICILGFPRGSVVKNLPDNTEDLGSIPEWGRSPESRHGNPLQYSCLENPHGQRSLVGCRPWGSKRVIQD